MRPPAGTVLGGAQLGVDPLAHDGGSAPGSVHIALRSCSSRSASLVKECSVSLGGARVGMWLAVKAMLHSVNDQPDKDAVHAQFDRLLDYVQDKLPEVHNHLDAARADILAFTAFPKHVWTQI